MPHPNLSMTESSSLSNIRLSPKSPNFLMVVALAGIFLIVFLVVSCLVVGDAGTKLMPGVHPRNAEPTSFLVLPASSTVEADV